MRGSRTFFFFRILKEAGFYKILKNTFDIGKLMGATESLDKIEVNYGKTIVDR